MPKENIIQVWRGLESARFAQTPLEGELIYTTDEKRVYIGDGVTAGGIFVGGVPILGAHFDGSSFISITGQPTGVTDTKVGTFAARFRAGNFDENRRILNSTLSKFAVALYTFGKLQVVGRTSVLVTILDNFSTTALSVNTWYNILLSWDLANDFVAQMYVNDTDDAAAAATFTDDTIDYTANAWSIGVTSPSNDVGLWEGDIAFLWFDHSRAIDFSTESNRRAFFDASGNTALDPNGDGTALGGQPLLYFAGGADQWHINKGSAGGTWTETGALTDIR